MKVITYWNAARPGVGQAPRSESQRPFLPQHARHCPVLEDGSSLGYLVYPSLEEHEGFHIQYQGEGRYYFRYFLRNPKGGWDVIFAITLSLPLGSPTASIGMLGEDVEFKVPDPPISREGALKMLEAFLIPENLGQPEGSVSLRGATNFKTPAGWDTVYSPIVNMIVRPVAPMLTVRVQTDWFMHETEFRYVLQPGEGIPGGRATPIGQVFFVSREDVELVECSAEELEEIRKAREEFFDEKREGRMTTRYGLEFSTHYLKRSRTDPLQD